MPYGHSEKLEAQLKRGDADTLDKVRPVLEAMSSRIIHIGPTGSGQATKAVNQVLCAGINQAVTEALAFAPGFKLALHHKDLKICQRMAEKAHVAIPLSAMTVTDYERLMAEGYGDEDISALYRLRKPVRPFPVGFPSKEVITILNKNNALKRSISRQINPPFHPAQGRTFTAFQFTTQQIDQFINHAHANAVAVDIFIRPDTAF